MLLWLTEYLAEFVNGFGVFQYLTFRTMVAVMTALVTSLVIGPMFIDPTGKAAGLLGRHRLDGGRDS